MASRHSRVVQLIEATKLAPIFFVALLATSAACAPESSLPPPRTPQGVAGPGGPALHAEALRQLAAAKSTAYRHHIRVDESSGVFEYDCSGLVDYAISNVSPKALATLDDLRETRRPNARNYVELLSGISGARDGWIHITDVAALAPGDIVAWIADNDKPDGFGVVNTGHVMIVDAPAHERAAGEWVVPIVDSSGGHGGDDTRKSPDATGIGRGTIVLIVENGAIAAYRWRESARSPLHRTKIALGRLQ